MEEIDFFTAINNTHDTMYTLNNTAFNKVIIAEFITTKLTTEPPYYTPNKLWTSKLHIIASALFPNVPNENLYGYFKHTNESFIGVNINDTTVHTTFTTNIRTSIAFIKSLMRITTIPFEYTYTMQYANKTILTTLEALLKSSIDASITLLRPITSDITYKAIGTKYLFDNPSVYILFYDKKPKYTELHIEEYGLMFKFIEALLLKYT
jgi:hypothetical protein